jgi:GNAT superfamily N-acetyltransferase
MMNITDFVVSRLDPDKNVAAFDCGDIELNDFLSNDAAKYQKARLSVTHILALPAAGQITEIVGYFCLLTDKLVFDPNPNNDKNRRDWLNFNKKHKIHFNKQRKVYPAVKIGRLAVATAFAGKGFGRLMIAHIITMIAEMNNVGCRFITVDAYKNAFGFYQNNHFNFLSDDDKDEKTRVMYLDIKRFYP